MKFLLYHSESESSYSFFSANSDKTKLFLKKDAKLIWSVNAKTYEVACLKQHKFLGWEPYKICITHINDLKKLLPENKFDLDNAELLINLGFPAIEPVMNDFLTWTEDANWPVSQIIYPFMVELDTKIVPYVDQILRTNDDDWKYFTMFFVVTKLSLKAKFMLYDLIERIALHPTKYELETEIDCDAREILNELSK